MLERALGAGADDETDVLERALGAGAADDETDGGAGLVSDGAEIAKSIQA